MGAETEKQETKVRIRKLLPADGPSVAAILQEAPEAANWTAASLEESLKWSGSLGLVSEAQGEISGFLLGRRVEGEAEILNLAVAPVRRRHGEGEALVGAAMAEFRASGVSRVFLEVRESNAGAMAFYQKQGFARTGRRSGYYRDPDEAAIVMEKKLTG
jgi:ribosomal-protein-alanine N-acetyltransferase